MKDSRSVDALAREIINSRPATEMIDINTGERRIVIRTEWLVNRRFLLYLAYLAFAVMIAVTATLSARALGGTFDFPNATKSEQYWYIMLILMDYTLYAGSFLMVFGYRKRQIAEKLMGDKENSTGIPSFLLGLALFVYGLGHLVAASILFHLHQEPFATWTAMGDKSLLICLIAAAISMIGGFLLAMGIRGKDLAQKY